MKQKFDQGYVLILKDLLFQKENLRYFEIYLVESNEQKFCKGKNFLFCAVLNSIWPPPFSDNSLLRKVASAVYAFGKY